MSVVLSEHLPLLAMAPDGIRKLRGLILELAVRGKLVPQDAGDEPKRTCLGAIGRWAVGSGFPTAEQGESGLEILFAKVSDMNLPENSRFIITTNNTISRETAKRLRANIHPAGTVVFPKIGGAIATNKRRILVRDTSIDNNCLGITPKTGVSSDWLYVLLASIDFSRYQAGTSVPALAQSVLAEIPVLLPSTIQQRRIVAKVDELIALCDRLETEQADAETAHARLVETLLATLTQSADATELAANWQRLAGHFDTLLTTEAAIDALKQTVLQLAVMGKLVPQDPDDEPASELLVRIAQEWVRLESAGILRKTKSKPPVSGGTGAFTLPFGWEWVRLQEIIKVSSGDGLTSDGMTKTGDIPVFGGNGVTGYHDVSNTHRQTLVIGRVGFYCGSIHLTPEKAWITDNALRVTSSEQDISIRFLYWLLRATNLKENESATAQPLVTGKKIYPIVVGLPPLAEQHRIVAKVDELMALCDRLKADLAADRKHRVRLADTLVQAALESA